MIVKKINPQGYCKGVILALDKCVKTINNPQTKKPIYLLGMIIHNKLVCNELESKGVIILEGSNKLELIKNITTGTVIISAHGVSKKVKNALSNLNVDIVDTTCPDVAKVHNNVFKYLDLGYEVLYIGKKNHPEAIGVLEEDNKIHLIDSLESINNLDTNKKYYVTNQTTLSHDFLSVYHEKLNETLNNLVIENNICLATTKREKALYDIETDLIVVVGDKTSSNTKKLYEVAKNKVQSKSVIIIERAYDLLNYDLSNYNEAYVTSGASTPNKVVNQVIRFLESDCKDKSILDEELLFF